MSAVTQPAATTLPRLAAFTRALFASRSSRIAGLILIVVLIATATGGLLAPADPLAQDAGRSFAAPSLHHLLGTDYLGRDNLSRLIAGTQATVASAIAIVAIGVVAGAVPGVGSVFLRPWAEFSALRTVDAMLSLPPIILAIAVAGLFSNGELSAVIAVGVLLAPRFFRIARADALGFARSQYVEAAVLMGASRVRLVRTHIWAKVLPTIAVTSAMSAGYAVLAVASLSFLGLGVQPPAPTWGSMLAISVQYLYQSTLDPVWPGVAIILTVWACNALADAIGDAAGGRRAG